MKPQSYLYELTEMTPCHVICRHYKEHFKLVHTEGLLSPATDTPASSQTQEGLESTFSFCFSPTLSLLLCGGTSSTDGVGDTPLAGAEVGEDGSAERIETPLSVIRTDLVPMADKGLSFLPLILAYISLLNFVVISARRKQLS